MSPEQPNNPLHGITLQAIVEVKSAGVSQRIGELVVETLGYYALPYPDELLIDNEGAVGHDYALGAIQSWLSSQTWGATIDTRKSVIAEAALGLETGQLKALVGKF